MLKATDKKLVLSFSYIHCQCLAKKNVLANLCTNLTNLVIVISLPLPPPFMQYIGKREKIIHGDRIIARPICI